MSREDVHVVKRRIIYGRDVSSATSVLPTQWLPTRQSSTRQKAPLPAAFGTDASLSPASHPLPDEQRADFSRRFFPRPGMVFPGNCIQHRIHLHTSRQHLSTLVELIWNSPRHPRFGCPHTDQPDHIKVSYIYLVSICLSFSWLMYVSHLYTLTCCKHIQLFLPQQ